MATLSSGRVRKGLHKIIRKILDRPVEEDSWSERAGQTRRIPKMATHNICVRLVKFSHYILYERAGTMGAPPREATEKHGRLQSGARGEDAGMGGFQCATVPTSDTRLD